MRLEVLTQKETNNSTTPVAVGKHLHLYQPLRSSADGNIHGEGEAVKEQFVGQDGGLQQPHNWNDLEAMLSYSPNAEAGNFEQVSFNLVPTLAQYLQKHHPETYQQIIAAPANLPEGEPHNVLGTPYFHAIMPLLPEHDQDTLLYWGRYDTERRFGVQPEGLWVPELAVDALSLEIAHRHGYDWTFGFRHQLEGRVDAPTAYNVSVGINDTIKILRESSHDKSVWHHFYQGGQDDMETFYKEAERQSVPDAPYPQIHVKATDGEHLKLQRDGANGWSRDLIDRVRKASDYKHKGDVRWVRPTTFMAEVQADNNLPQAELADTTAGEGTFDERMAQTHGLDRWTGEVDGETTVLWKRELQRAYRSFSDNMDAVYKAGMQSLGIDDAWEARNEYIRFLHGEMDEREFFSQWNGGMQLDGQPRRQALKLLASQYHKLAASSSCGWFFDKPSGVEPKIVTRQMRIAVEHLRTSGLEMTVGVDETDGSMQAIATDEGDTRTEIVNGEQIAGYIEGELLDNLRRVMDERTNLGRVYKGIGATSVGSLILPPQYRQ